MLEPIKHILKTKRIILASSSPRRKEIFHRNLGLDVEIIPSKFAEDLDKSKFASYVSYAVENSRLKAIDVAESLKQEEWLAIIGSDTVVEMNGLLFEKPKDKQDAFEMLKKLSGNTHQVHSGVTILKRKEGDEYDQVTFHETSHVEMAHFDDQVIRAYVETGEPLDKAGGYGIQDLGASLVKAINGDYFNIEGFPAFKFAVEFKKLFDF